MIKAAANRFLSYQCAVTIMKYVDFTQICVGNVTRL